MRPPIALFVMFLTCGAGLAHAAGPGILALLPDDAESVHTITLGLPPGATHKQGYVATAGTLPLFDAQGVRIASVFYTAYVSPGVGRPLTFVVNGGPGAASAYLHLGLVGPRLLQFGTDGDDGTAPVLRDNPQSWLDFTDLVIIDPVGTGWSRTARPGDAARYWGVREDAESLAKVVALYVARADRSASPKYLLGESYGGLRIVKMAVALQHKQGIVVAGLLMISPVLDGMLTFGGDRLALGAALKLPSIAAAELERRHRFTPAALADAEHFAMTEYLTTLAAAPPTGVAADAFYARVAAMSGLSASSVARTHGFLGEGAWRPEGQVISAYDATVAVADIAPVSGAEPGDLVLQGFTRAFGGAFVGYARDALGFHTDLTYRLLCETIAAKWNWHSDSGNQRMPEAGGDLRNLLTLNTNFRVLVASGYTDLVTPFEAARYVLDHIPTVGKAGRVIRKVYPGGHMIYLDDASRRALTADAAEFYRHSPGQQPTQQ